LVLRVKKAVIFTRRKDQLGYEDPALPDAQTARLIGVGKSKERIWYLQAIRD
jgi:hypothetical protein